MAKRRKYNMQNSSKYKVPIIIGVVVIGILLTLGFTLGWFKKGNGDGDDKKFGNRNTTYDKVSGLSQKGIYMIDSSDSFRFKNNKEKYETTSSSNIFCYKSKFIGNKPQDDTFCSTNYVISQIFLVYCKNNVKESPKQYLGEGGCPGRTHIFLFQNGNTLNPDEARDSNDNVISLKDLSFDIGIGVNNKDGKYIRMDDVHIDTKEEIENGVFLFKLLIGSDNKCEYHLILCENL